MIDLSRLNSNAIYQVSDLMEIFQHSRTGVETIVRGLTPLNLGGHKKYSGEQLLNKLRASKVQQSAKSLAYELKVLKVKYNALVDDSRMTYMYDKEVI